MSLSNLSLRKLSLLGLIICAGILASAMYLEYEYMLATCPLCILQRVFYAALGVVFFIGSIIKFSGAWRYLYSSIIVLLSGMGTAIAIRQFWLQYFAPPQKVSCAASLEHLMEIYPILDALKIALQGSGECAKIDFTILTISIAGWSLIVFGIMFILSLYIMYLQKKRWI